jgi:uncharacterized membrane protein
MRRDVNVAGIERWASSMAGAGLATLGLKQLRDERPLAGAALTAAGAALILRGASGHCPVYEATGITTAFPQYDTRARLSGTRGVHVEEATTINRSPEDLYAFWRDFELLPRFMHNLDRVRVIDERHSHWVAKGPANRPLQWTAEIINDEPYRLIGWRTVGRADVVSAGSVHFEPVAGTGETQVRIKLQYDPPAGKLGAAVAWMIGREPSQTIRDDLRRFKQLMEAGEIPTVEGQPRGAR